MIISEHLNDNSQRKTRSAVSVTYRNAISEYGGHTCRTGCCNSNRCSKSPAYSRTNEALSNILGITEAMLLSVIDCHF